MTSIEREIAEQALSLHRDEEMAQLAKVERESTPPDYRTDTELSGQDNRPRRPILGIRA
jgi:hypothetical protein